MYMGDGCMNCKAMLPVFDALAGEYPGVKFEKVNTANAQSDVETYGIAGIPTLLFFKGKDVVGKLVGQKPKSLVVKKIAEVFQQ